MSVSRQARGLDEKGGTESPFGGSTNLVLISWDICRPIGADKKGSRCQDRPTGFQCQKGPVF